MNILTILLLFWTSNSDSCIILKDKNLYYNIITDNTILVERTIIERDSYTIYFYDSLNFIKPKIYEY